MEQMPDTPTHDEQDKAINCPECGYEMDLGPAVQAVARLAMPSQLELAESAGAAADQDDNDPRRQEVASPNPNLDRVTERILRRQELRERARVITLVRNVSS